MNTKIIKKYKIPIKQQLLKAPNNFEIFLTHYDSEKKSDYNFPDNITDDELNNWARRYCELDDCNLNHLKQLTIWSNKHDHKIDSKVIVKAKKKREELTQKYFSEHSGIRFKYSVTFKSNLNKDRIFEFIDDSNNYNIAFNQEWIDNNLDYATLLQNFIYFFGYFDQFQRFALVNNFNDLSQFERILFTHSKYEYKTGATFDAIQSIYILTMYLYYDYLSYKGIDMESLFEYYYQDLLVNELQNKSFNFISSPVHNDYYHRIKSLLPELDNLLKTFDIYREDGFIDEELFELDSKPRIYKDIKSIIPNKFVYLTKQTEYICCLIFSKDSILSTFEETKKKSIPFFELVLKGVLKSDFKEYQYSEIDHLIELGYISENILGKLSFTDEKCIILYKLIWDKGYFPAYQLPEEYLQVLDFEINKGNLEVKDTLFSRQESDYISYILDDKKYNNGLKIRNKYIHGVYCK